MHRATVYRLLKRVRTEGETAYRDERHGHSIKLRGEVRTFLIQMCQAAPSVSSPVVQQAIQERFGLSISVSQLNRVRVSLGLSRPNVLREKKPLGWQAYLDGRGDTGGRRTADRKERGSMTEANDAETYEQRVQAIQLSNQPILDGFETWLRQSGLSEQTIRDHVDHIRFFSRYLLLYAYSQRRLDEATEGAVYDFLEDWFPRKALWASVSSMKVYLASFKKFFKWMGATGLVSPATVEDVLSTLKDDRNLFLRKVAE